MLLGITFSPVEDLARWQSETRVGGHLLCDAERAVAMRYGAASSADQPKAARLSVLVDGDGVVRKVYDGPDVNGHADAVVADVSSL